MPWSSNGTFLVELCHDGDDGTGGLQAGARRAAAVGLSRRACTSARSPPYELSEALGWGIVPPTVLRDDAPIGRARCSGSSTPTSSSTTSRSTSTRRPIPQLDDDRDLRPPRQQHRPQERPLPARRRRSHLRRSTTVCASHVESKLRTVIWEFGGEPIPDDLVEDVARVARGGAARVAGASRRRRDRRGQEASKGCRRETGVPGRYLRSSVPVADGVTRAPRRGGRPRRARPTGRTAL